MTSYMYTAFCGHYQEKTNLLPVLLRRDESGEEAGVVQHLQLAEDVHVGGVGHGGGAGKRRLV